MRVRYDMINCHVIRWEGGQAQFLQLRRSPRESMGNTWGIVRGGVEAGEKAWQAALRELREETAIEPAEFYQLDTLASFYLASDDSFYHCPGFCAVITPRTPIVLDEEHDAIRWIARDQIDAVTLWPGEREQVREILREIVDDGPARPYLLWKWKGT